MISEVLFKLPLSINQDGLPFVIDARGHTVIDREGYPGIATRGGDEFIVRACNSHEALVAALEFALLGAKNLAACGPGEPQLADEVVAQMEAALKLAKP